MPPIVLDPDIVKHGPVRDFNSQWGQRGSNTRYDAVYIKSHVVSIRIKNLPDVVQLNGDQLVFREAVRGVVGKAQILAETVGRKGAVRGYEEGQPFAPEGGTPHVDVKEEGGIERGDRVSLFPQPEWFFQRHSSSLRREFRGRVGSIGVRYG
ncbi:hypothetical protein RHMOL_Rhmol08G0029700 [Rhododendron molle]|uniref:Uncharacterized protein n=1 Tax=Rhododendron molle TaxID=49168 RepID=A0ACC0MJ68_RHOML|nr:hypothetical protein RHMOL_Rhmol08G0029700 [Rhododendron molle]